MKLTASEQELRDAIQAKSTSVHVYKSRFYPFYCVAVDGYEYRGSTGLVALAKALAALTQ